jgi:hypothetical protein
MPTQDFDSQSTRFRTLKVSSTFKNQKVVLFLISAPCPEPDLNQIRGLKRLKSKIPVADYQSILLPSPFAMSRSNFSFFSGGTLGLFCGMSIMSIFEIFIWLVRLVTTFLGSHSKNGKMKQNLQH